MSSDKQEDSPDRQRGQILPYAERRGYDIVAEFVDEGIGGSDRNLHRRDGYRRLCEAAKAKQFDLLLLDKLDRLSRADPIDWGATVKPLRDAGLRLETVARGPVDWRDPFGQMAAMFEQSGNNGYARSIGYNVLSRLRQMAAQGIYTGPCPYGYVRGPDGRPVPDGYRAEVVAWLFRTYADTAATVADLIRELHARGVRSPRGREWWGGTGVFAVLENRAYVGDFTWNKQTRAEYYRVHGGQLVEVGRCAAEPEAFVIRDNHPPLIDRATWERVQAKRARTPRRTTPVAGGGGWLLTGLLVCGHCGCRMRGTTIRGVRSYICGSYHTTRSQSCGRHTIPERPVADFLVRLIRREFLDADKLATLRAELLAQAEQARRAGPGRADKLRVKLAKLDRAVERGARRVLTADDDEAPDLRKALAGLRAERAELARQVEAAAQVPDMAAVEEEVRRSEAMLWQLGERLASADPMQVRAVFQEMASRVELFWERRPQGHRKYHFSHGVLYLRSEDGATSVVPCLNGTTCRSGRWGCRRR
jgi:site-specific DNA recombinase